MKVVIMGWGRVGSTVAERLDADGHDVTILDTDPAAFRRLPETFEGHKIVGAGDDDETLQRVGIEDADAFLALTQGDNRNLLASQMAKHLFDVETVVSRVYDPLRGELFARLGLRTFSPTKISAELAIESLLGTT